MEKQATSPALADQADPRYHSGRIKDMLKQTAEHCREDVRKVNDPHAKALFETTAEVLNGLTAAFEHFETQSEEAWK